MPLMTVLPKPRLFKICYTGKIDNFELPTVQVHMLARFRNNNAMLGQPKALTELFQSSSMSMSKWVHQAKT